MVRVLIRTVRDFLEDDCPTNAAAIAYYAVFSLPAVLFLLLALVGAVVDPQTVREKIIDQFGGMIGSESARQIEGMLVFVSRKTSGDGTRVLIGVLALLLGASGAFGQLQSALNRAWEVKEDSRKAGVKSFVLKRIASFGMVLTIAFLLLISLAISALLTSVGDYVGLLLGGVPGALLNVVQAVLSFVVIATLFSIMFKVLPDAEIGWKDVWIGGAVTALLFTIGKFAIGAYLGRSKPGTAFGAAGALAVLLIWIYYSANIVLFGAELTQAISRLKGHSMANGSEREQQAA